MVVLGGRVGNGDFVLEVIVLIRCRDGQLAVTTAVAAVCMTRMVPFTKIFKRVCFLKFFRSKLLKTIGDGVVFLRLPNQIFRIIF